MTEAVQPLKDYSVVVAPVVEQANGMVVSDQTTRRAAIVFLQAVKEAQRTVTAELEPLVKRAHDNWKAMVAYRDKYLTPLKQAEQTVKTVVSAFDAEEQEKRLQEQRRLQAEADAAAARERARLEKEAARLKTPELREDRLAQAQAVTAHVIQVQAPERQEGVAYRSTWKAVVLDPQAVPREWLIVNDQALQTFARATKGTVPVPGVRFDEVRSLAIGRSKRYPTTDDYRDRDGNDEGTI